jgi:hypothetical protein
MLGGYVSLSRTSPYKDILDILLYLLILSGVFVLATLGLYGTVWVSEKLYPSLVNLAQVTLAIVVFLLLPLAFFTKTRPWSGFGMVVASYIIGLSLWVLSVLVTIKIWGIGGLLIGLLLSAGTVVPVAFLASVLHSLWPSVGDLLFGVLITLAPRLLGGYLLARSETTV